MNQTLLYQQVNHIIANSLTEYRLSRLGFVWRCCSDDKAINRCPTLDYKKPLKIRNSAVHHNFAPILISSVSLYRKIQNTLSFAQKQHRHFDFSGTEKSRELKQQSPKYL